MKPATRLQILNHLRKNQGLSAVELSRLLGVTGANIRHHLQILETNDLIEVVGQRREPRGRPGNVYGLSRRMLGDALDELASGLLGTLQLGNRGQSQQNALQSVAHYLAGGIDTQGEKAIPRRLAHSINRLNELHYQARWEAGAGGARVILGHCPYLAIAGDHPELCQLDSYLLENLLSMPVRQTEKLQPSIRGLAFCAFLAGGL